jgi:hypothetical protein
MEHVLEERRGRKVEGKKKTEHADSWMHANIEDLDLEDPQVALLLSTILTAIEGKNHTLNRKRFILLFGWFPIIISIYISMPQNCVFIDHLISSLLAKGIRCTTTRGRNYTTNCWTGHGRGL